MRLPPLPAEQWDDAVRSSALAVMLPQERRNPGERRATCCPRWSATRPDEGVPAVQRPPAVQLDAAAPAARAGDPAGRAPHATALRVGAPRRDGPARRA